MPEMKAKNVKVFAMAPIAALSLLLLINSLHLWSRFLGSSKLLAEALGTYNVSMAQTLAFMAAGDAILATLSLLSGLILAAAAFYLLFFWEA
jgi:hypothetical protein